MKKGELPEGEKDRLEKEYQEALQEELHKWKMEGNPLFTGEHLDAPSFFVL